MKKILAILLSLALVICMLPASAVTAFADTISLTDDMITLLPASGTYTGATIVAPTVTVKGAAAADFDVQCGTITNAGDYTITVNAKTDSTVLSGSAKATFTVAPRDLGTAGVNIVEKSATHLAASDLNDASKINATDYFAVEYKGTDITSDCTLTVEKGGTTSAPAAVVTATAYSGNVVKMITRSFTIKTDLSGATVKQSGTLTYNGKAQKPTFTATLKSADGKTTTTLKQDTDFEVVDYTATEATTSTATIRGIGNYYGELKNVEYTIGAKSLSSSNTTIAIPNITIGGKFSITVRDKDLDKELNGSDYYLSPETPSDFQKAGTYNITINGTGNYKGSISTTYRVVKEDNLIKSDDVTCKDRNVLYTGSKQEISTTVVVGNTTLRKGTDYTIAYYDIYADDKDKDKAVDPKNVSTYSVYLQGKGDYAVNSSDSKGLRIASFTIQPISLDRITVNFSSSTKYDSSSRAYVPKVSLKASNGAVIPTTDYDVKYYGFNSSYKTQYVVVTLVEKGKKGIDQTEASTGSLAETSRGKDSIEEDYKGATIDQNNTKNISVTFDKAYYKDGTNQEKVMIKSGNRIDYVGERIYLDLSVYDSDSRRYLESYEYTVTYKNSSNRTVSYMYDADAYTVIIESTSDYENRYSRSFKVEKTFIIGHIAAISAEEAACKVGNTVRIPINLTNNPGLASLKLELSYDTDVFEFVSAENGKVFPSSSFRVPSTDETDAKVLLWNNSTIKENITDNGRIAFVTFRIKDGVQTGKYTVSLLCNAENKDAININGQTVPIQTSAISIIANDFEYGDLDDNGRVDASDVLQLERYLAKWSAYSGINANAADVDGDGIVSLRDVTILERHIAGWEWYETLPMKVDALPV